MLPESNEELIMCMKIEVIPSSNCQNNLNRKMTMGNLNTSMGSHTLSPTDVFLRNAVSTCVPHSYSSIRYFQHNRVL